MVTWDMVPIMMMIIEVKAVLTEYNNKSMT